MVNAQDVMKDDYIVADVKDTVSSLIGQMDRHKQTMAVVFDNGKYLGMAAKKWLLSSRIDPSKMLVKNLLTHRSKSKTPFFVPKLDPETDLAEIARLLVTADIRALPVVVTEKKKEKVVGVVHSIDVLDALRTFYSRVRVDEIASMKLVTVHQDDDLGKAINLMSKEGIGHVVVLDDSDKLVGIVSMTDILTDVSAFPRVNMHISKAASHQQGKRSGFGVGEKTSILKLPVHNILTHVPNCATSAPEGSVADAIGQMVENNVASVVLIKKDIPIGIITAKDILEDYSKK